MGATRLADPANAFTLHDRACFDEKAFLKPALLFHSATASFTT
jgi:hypothetical protein